jgi:sulfatase modifying factor 1
VWLLGFAPLIGACEIIAPLDDVNQDAGSGKGCASLLGSKILTDSTGAMWGAAVVPIANSPECIYMDTTEVTVAAYTAWATANPGFTKWHVWCAWKGTGPSNPAGATADTCAANVPTSQELPFAPQKPIRCVDWCDAEAFCRSARGGRLCYRYSVGGSSQPEGVNNEWPSACSNASTTEWPWGNSRDGGVCNVGQSPQGCGTDGFSCGPAVVQTYPTCVNQAQIFDLVGNVSEWLGVCSAQMLTTASSSCMIAGGSYANPFDTIRCDDVSSLRPKSSRLPDVGIRCCYDLTLVERRDAGLP